MQTRARQSGAAVVRGGNPVRSRTSKRRELRIGRRLREAARARSRNATLVCGGDAVDGRWIHNATVRAHSAPSLELPDIPLDFPTEVNVHSYAIHIADLAESLLEFGLISERHWQGELLSSLRFSLQQRFFDFVPVAGPLGSLTISVGDPTDLINHHIGDMPDEAEGKEIASLDFEPGRYEEVFVKEAVDDLEKLCPMAGFAVLKTLCECLEGTIGAVTPEWCYSEIEAYHEYNADYDPENDACEDDDEEGLPKPNKLLRLLPIAQMRHVKYAQHVLRKALGKKPNDRQRRLLENALQLENDTEVAVCEDISTRTYHDLPIAIRWSEYDRVQQISDWHHDIVADGDGICECFVGCFTSVPKGHVLSAHTVANAYRVILRRLGICSQILADLQWPKTLMETFAYDAAAEQAEANR